MQGVGGVLMPARGEGAVHAFLDEYYRHAAPEDLIGHDAKDVRSAAVSHAALASTRPQGTAKVRVHTPTVAANGWTSGHTVVEVVTDDMPFLVDSITAELSRQDRGIHVIIHPQLWVRRDLAGNLLEVLAPDQDRSGWTRQLESWIHIEIDRLGAREDAAGQQYSQIEADLLRVLRDVRESVEDWPKMRATALSLAETLHPAGDGPEAAGAAGGDGRRLGPAALAGRRPLRLPGVPRVRPDHRRRRRGAAARHPRHRPGHPARRPGRSPWASASSARTPARRPTRSGCWS